MSEKDRNRKSDFFPSLKQERSYTIRDDPNIAQYSRVKQKQKKLHLKNEITYKHRNKGRKE